MRLAALVVGALVVVSDDGVQIERPDDDATGETAANGDESDSGTASTPTATPRTVPRE